ncbi:ABC transporter ATP-binding protein [Bradyrhizobium iriomotense]|uniref:Spermidine/putrescine import ATP-binding protein PotA n=1 Tax=Bradyrhizobium iriomotense TaxID=441950 RepID=A0ABQ6B7B6_9BRAD|nr:ABC transporter ATP-binding protein [Bradyrhizobium iriomotense]GLR87932.1 spermidine/putrescine ABC transporter ATPase [Bradyrhizobium iriomotense]
MTGVQLESVCKFYGDFRATEDVNLTIANGEFLVLLGPSGCGKTTTLRMVAGFVEPTRGSIRIGNVDVTHLPPWKRSTGLVFQSYALFPHLTVHQNVAFGLEMRKVPKSEISEKVMTALQMVRLDHLGERYPRQLSGGQQQRVALARALAFRPDVLLLDEPLSNLDAKLRHEVRVEIRNLQQRLGITTVMVTHDQEEALTMADRLVVMNEGRIQQVGSQRDLYDRPQSQFVASFVGRSSFLNGRAGGARFVTAGGLPVVIDSRLEGEAVIALRPERITLANAPLADTPNNLPGEVEFVSYMGNLIDVHVRLNQHDHVIAQIVNRDDTNVPAVKDRVFVSWAPSSSVFAK